MNATEQLQRQFEELPPDKQVEVLDFVTYLRARYGKQFGSLKSLLAQAGRLKGSPHLNDDPLVIQRSLRDEW